MSDYGRIANGTLPRFSMIEPRMASSSFGPSNSQHPDFSVVAGEELLADIYEALRNSSYWQTSMLLITWDEHGGLYDHQPPPQTGVPAPDGVLGSNGFGFDRLGVRVPMVVVSPFVARGTVVHEPQGAQAPTPTSQFDHTSIIATANRIFGIADNMTARDAWAGRLAKARAE
jgi:phospholipase C